MLLNNEIVFCGKWRYVFIKEKPYWVGQIPILSMNVCIMLICTWISGFIIGVALLVLCGIDLYIREKGWGWLRFHFDLLVHIINWYT